MPLDWDDVDIEIPEPEWAKSIRENMEAWQDQMRQSRSPSQSPPAAVIEIEDQTANSGQQEMQEVEPTPPTTGASESRSQPPKPGRIRIRFGLK